MGSKWPFGFPLWGPNSLSGSAQPHRANAPAIADVPDRPLPRIRITGFCAPMLTPVLTMALRRSEPRRFDVVEGNLCFEVYADVCVDFKPTRRLDVAELVWPTRKRRRARAAVRGVRSGRCAVWYACRLGFSAKCRTQVPHNFRLAFAPAV